MEAETQTPQGAMFTAPSDCHLPTVGGLAALLSLPPETPLLYGRYVLFRVDSSFSVKMRLRGRERDIYFTGPEDADGEEQIVAVEPDEINRCLKDFIGCGAVEALPPEFWPPMFEVGAIDISEPE